MSQLERPQDESAQPEHPMCNGHEHSTPQPRVRGASPQALDRAARIFRAAGDVSRLRVLDQLMDGERCVTEMAESLGVQLSTLSQQLRILRSEDLVVTRRVGKHIYYSLADGHVVSLISNVLAHADEGAS